MRSIKLSWSDFKSMHQDKKIPIQMRETENAYELMQPEGGTTWYTHIFKSTDPNYDALVLQDYQTKYESLINQPLQPRSEDGRVLMLPVTLDKGIWHWFCGAGDHPTLGKAKGQIFQVSTGIVETKKVDWSFNDWIALSGGIARYRGATLGDVCDFYMMAPASVPVASANNTGNCNKVPTGLGFNILIPAPGTGAWNLDLATKATPLPNATKEGYWDWSWPDEGRGTFTPCPGTGHYDFFDVPLPMIRFIARVPLLGAGQLEFNPQNPHPTFILPHWVMTCEVTRSKVVLGETLEMIWHMMAARKKTT